MSGGADDLERTLAEQMAYYEARAAEYDEWWLRKGRYDQGPELNARWLAEAAEVRAALAAHPLTGSVLELACGTGNWTELLAGTAAHLTALDASPAMLAINRRRLEGAGLADRVTYGQVDLFAWRPDRLYDACFLGFFLSHVPEARLDDLLATVDAAVRPGGRVVYVDSRPEPTSSSPDQPLPSPETELMRRRLNDGREFDVIKVYRSARQMHDAFARHGIALAVHETAHYFQYGFGVTSPPM